MGDGGAAVLSYSIDEIKKAAYRKTFLPNMTYEERSFWEGMAYCYERLADHPEEKEELAKCAKNHERHFLYRKAFYEEIEKAKGKD